MQTDHVLHEAAMSILFTGSMQLGRPSWGSWVTYALGSENKDLPEFVVMLSGKRDGGSPPHPRMWHNGYLPGRYQGCPFRSGKEPVFFVSNPEGIDAKTRRRILDAVKALERARGRDDRRSGSDRADSRLRDGGSHADERARADGPLERARRRARAVRREPGKESFANNCLLARRLAERGVRFIQLMDSGWDHHNNIPVILKKKMEEADKPIAALLGDLKQSGLLEDTLVIFCGEFGRTSYCEGPMSFASYGRDHHQLCGGLMLAGGGFRGGFAYGETDEWGWDVVKDPVHVHDLQATVLHALGLDHLRLVTRYQGRDFRLTDVAGKRAQAAAFLSVSDGIATDCICWRHEVVHDDNAILSFDRLHISRCLRRQSRRRSCRSKRRRRPRSAWKAFPIGWRSALARSGFPTRASGPFNASTPAPTRSSPR